jgi:hypothetical protein
MNEREILEELAKLGIITSIAGQFFITEKYKELLAGTNVIQDVVPEPKKSKTIDNYELLNTEGSETAWPADVAQTAGRVRADHFMTFCKIPVTAPDGSYRLRSLPLNCLSIIDNIVAQKDINPLVMSTSIAMYYEHTKYPKTFKNLLLEGEVINIYNEYVSGEFQKSMLPPDNNNQQCR